MALFLALRHAIGKIRIGGVALTQADEPAAGDAPVAPRPNGAARWSAVTG